MAVDVSQVAVGIDMTHMQIPARCRPGPRRGLIADRRPVRSLHHLEQTHALTRSPHQRRVGCAVAGEEPAHPLRHLQCQGRAGIADVELLDLPPAPVDAASRVVEQPGRQTQHMLRDRAPLCLVAIEQGMGRAAEHGGEFPTEVIGVLQAGVQPLRAGRRMRVGGIAGEKGAADAVAVRDTRVHAICRAPGNGPDHDVIAAGALVQHLRQAAGRHVHVAFEGDRSLELEELGAG